MDRILRLVIPLFCIVLASGCVSSKEHKARLADIESLNKTVNEYEGKLNAAEQENANLKTEMSKLLSDHKTVTTERDRLKASLAETNAKLQENAAALSATVTEVAVLKREQEKLKNVRAREVSDLKESYDRLKTGMQKQIEQGQIELTQLKDRLSLRMVNKILFDSGRATVKTEGKKVLDEVANALTNFRGSNILIAGHTDDVPISAGLAETFPTNWELSTARATNVVRYLESTGKIDPKLLGVAAFSEYRPVATNDTPEGRAKNRRIEITLVPIELSEAGTEPSGTE